MNLNNIKEFKKTGYTWDKEGRRAGGRQDDIYSYIGVLMHLR